MSITKLKTVGSWHMTRWQNDGVAERRTSVRGRVITGMLTGGDACSDAPAAAEDPHEERAR